jgi:hypothetical protein
LSLSARQAITWVIFAVTGIALAIALGVGFTAVALPACESCHMRGDFAAATTAAAHADQDCVSCHVDPSPAGRLSFAVRQDFHMVIRLVRDLDRSYAAVPAERCLSCHGQVMAVGKVGTKGLYVNHDTCAKGQECSSCHSATAHGTATSWIRTVRMEQCYTCHGVSNKVTDCDACHAARLPNDRVNAGTFAVTHGPQWQTTHGMGEMGSCSACHEPAKCVGCHGAGVPHSGDFRTQHSTFSTAPNAQCATCHKQEFCDACHAYPMPHDHAFVLGHSATVEQDGDARCFRCHTENDCTTCHVRHVHPVTQEQMDSMLKSPGVPR